MRLISNEELVFVGGGGGDGEDVFANLIAREGVDSGPGYAGFGDSWDGNIQTVTISGSSESIGWPSAFQNEGFWGMVGAFGAAIVGIALAPEMVVVAGTVYIAAEVAAVVGVAMVGAGGVGVALTHPQ